MNMNSVRNLMPLNDEQLYQRAPAILAEKPMPGVSHRYRQVPTIEVVNTMRNEGWFPVSARQVNVREEGREEFGKHEIRFARLDDGATTGLQVGGIYIQAVLTNSHDRSSCFVFQLGAFRLVCSNGMMAPAGAFGAIHIRHVGFNPREVVRASGRIIEGGKGLSESIQRMSGIRLEQGERLALARAAAPLIVDPAEGWIEPARLLEPRRYEDRKSDLWSTFNTLQENAIRGRVPAYRRDPEGPVTLAVPARPNARRVIPRRYRPLRTREVKNIGRDHRLNQALWALAEEMGRLKAGQSN